VIIGLAGAHRVGKTTLAIAYASSAKIRLLTTSVSASLAKAGFNARSALTLSERLEAQTLVLEDCIQLWSAQEELAITDRTPLDLIAYTIGEVTMSRASNLMEDEALEKALGDYVDKCLAAADKYFAKIVVVQPGIKIVNDAKSAAASRVYISHINHIIAGLAVEHDHHIMPTCCLSLASRVQYLKTVASSDLYLPERYLAM
jgi:hypothetical protein